MATTQEIIELQRKHKRLSERSKTILADLRGLEGFDKQLKADAAEVIEWLQTQNAQLRKDLNEEIRDGQRSARDAYAQGQQDEHDRNREW